MKKRTQKTAKEKMTFEDIRIWQKAMNEIRAVVQVLEALENLPQAERRRLLNYFYDRYVTHPAKGN